MHMLADVLLLIHNLVSYYTLAKGHANVGLSVLYPATSIAREPLEMHHPGHKVAPISL